MKLDKPSLNALWGALIVEELIRNDVTYFCISPGSRSTPLALAVAENERAMAIVCLDERGAAFHALGYARATGRPAALICTSGTAVANYFPAMIEAAQDQVPMLVLSADRPPELRDTGANQTIDQVHLFGRYVRWQLELPCPEPNLPPAQVLTGIDQAVYRARRAPAGPVHINVMLREPLAPTPDGVDIQRYGAALAQWQQSGTSYTRYSPLQSKPEESLLRELGETIESAPDGLLIVGKLAGADEAAAALNLAHHLQWPVFADVRSGLRSCTAPEFVCYHDLLLLSESLQNAWRPQVILQLGAPATSKRLATFLARLRPSHYWLVDNHPKRIDPDHLVTLRIESDITAFCERLSALLPVQQPGVWLARLQQASALAGQCLQPFVDRRAALSEPAVAHWVVAETPPSHGLFLASSMPIRDVQMFAPAISDGFQALAANRGASGIDGTIATASGYGAGLDQPVVLLIGDLALLHDLNSLALLAALKHPVTIVLLNNNGGGIFSFLPVARQKRHFERFFGTPHNLTFAATAQQFDLGYVQPDSATAFFAAFRRALAGRRSTLIEIRTDRQENVRLHEELFRRIRESIPAFNAP